MPSYNDDEETTTSTPKIDVTKLTSVCQFDVPYDDLYKPDDRGYDLEIWGLRKILEELNYHRNRTRIFDLTPMIDSAIAKTDKLKEEIGRSQLYASEFVQIPSRALMRIEDIMLIADFKMTLPTIDDNIKKQIDLIEKANDTQNEMQVAEDQMWTKIDLLQKVLVLVKNKLDAIKDCEELSPTSQAVEGIQKQALVQTAERSDEKLRLKQRCEADIKSLKDAMMNADLEESEATKRVAAAKVTAATGDATEQLEKEVKQRQAEYADFLKVCEHYKKCLECTMHNCDVAETCFRLVEEIVTEACTAMKTRFENTIAELDKARLEAHKEKLEYFRMLFSTAGSIIRKAEKNENNNGDDKIKALKEQRAKALEDFKETEYFLKQAGVEFTHPADEE